MTVADLSPAHTDPRGERQQAVAMTTGYANKNIAETATLDALPRQFLRENNWGTFLSLMNWPPNFPPTSHQW